MGEELKVVKEENKELKLTGKQMFMGVEIPVIEGGFGDDKRVTTAKTISEIHNTRLADVNATIKRMIKKGRLRQNVDYIDCLSETVSLRDFAEKMGLVGSNRTRNVFILSERGYSKLIKAMDDDTSWDVMENFINDYFEMRSAIKASISEKDLAIIAIVNAKSEVERALAINKLENLVAQPLIDTIEKQKPMAALAELRIDKKGCYTITDVTKAMGFKKGQITKWAKAVGFIHKNIKEVNKAGEKFFKVYSSDGVHNSIGIKEEGLQEINNNREVIMGY